MVAQLAGLRLTACRMLCLISGVMVIEITGSSGADADCIEVPRFFNVTTKLENSDFSKKSGELMP